MKYILRVAFKKEVNYSSDAQVAGIFLEIVEGKYDYDLSKVMNSIIESMLVRTDPFMIDLHEPSMYMRDPEMYKIHIQKKFKGARLRYSIDYLSMEVLEDHIIKVTNYCINNAITGSRIGNREYGPSFNAQIDYKVINKEKSKTTALLELTFS